MLRDALFSPCGTYRHWLYREWNAAKPLCCFCMVNPSKAGKELDDHTATKCVGFADRLGCGGYYVVNLNDFVATNIKEMLAAPAPSSPENDKTILSVASMCAFTICAWGNHGKHRGRDQHVLKLLREAGIKLKALKLNAGGVPAHPLMLSYSLQPVEFNS